MLVPPHDVKRPPAYQRYAADHLAREEAFRRTLEQRGLLASMQDACWLSDDSSVPSDPGELAIIVRRTEAEVARALPAVLDCFDQSIPGRLVDIELRAYKAKLMDRRKQLSNAGDKGNKTRWGERSSDGASDPSSDGASDPSLSTAQHSTTQSVGAPGSLPHLDPWVADLERAEAEEQQRRRAAVEGASKGLRRGSETAGPPHPTPAH